MFGVRSNLSASGTQPVVLEDCVISDINSGGDDRGIYGSNAIVDCVRTTFRNCGGAGTISAGFRQASGSARIEDCVFEDNEASGLMVLGRTVSLSCSSFLHNAVGITRSSGDLHSSSCGFVGNTEFAVQNTGPDQLNVCCSWWGDASGPDAPGGSGTGDAITSNVGYIPFSVTDDACGFDCLAGDANNDGNIDLADLNLVLANFGGSVEIGTDGDVNDDGVVDLADLNLVLANFGEACEASV